MKIRRVCIFWTVGIMCLAVVPCSRGQSRDVDVDRLWGILGRPWRIRLVGIDPVSGRSPLVAAGLPPYSQQAETAQNIRPPVLIEVQTKTPLTKPSPAPSPPPPPPGPNEPPGPND